MAQYHALLQDNGLSELSYATHLYLCSQEPTTYAQATTTYALANYSGPSFGAAEAGTPAGARKRVMTAITGMTVTANGTATHWALVDSVSSRLLAANSLTASKALSTPGTVDTGTLTFTIPAYVSA